MKKKNVLFISFLCIFQLFFPFYSYACYNSPYPIDRTEAECESIDGASCTTACTSGQVSIGKCTGNLTFVNCTLSKEKYKKLVEEGKLPPDPNFEPPKKGAEECKQAGGTCSDSCTDKGGSIGFCDETTNPKTYCCGKKSGSVTSPSSFKYTPLEPIPGAEGIDGSTLAGFLQSLYVFALWSAGVMAMFMVGIGGFWYLTSAGNTARVGEAKTIITNALIGLLVLMFTWLILYVINPDLTKLDWTSLEMLSIGTSMSTYRGGPGSGNSGGSGGPGNGQCEEITTGHCGVEELKKSCFQRFEGQNPNIYTQASQICNVESRGNINSKSDVDKCKDGTPFSYGLFQINFTYHCPGGMAGGKNSSCTGTGPNYASCMSNYTGESGWANNIQKACDLYAGRGWGDWKNTREKCGF